MNIGVHLRNTFFVTLVILKFFVFQELASEFRDELTNVLYQSDPNGNQVAYQYGDRQELLSFTDSGGNIYNVDYDDSGRLTGFTNPDGNRTVYIYDENDLISRVINLDASELSYSYNSDSQMVCYGMRYVWSTVIF